MGKETGLNDINGTAITDGCTVEIVNSVANMVKGYRLLCVWNIPNHRYGFHPLEYEEYDTPSNRTSEFLYLTPKNASKLKVIRD